MYDMTSRLTFIPTEDWQQADDDTRQPRDHYQNGSQPCRTVPRVLVGVLDGVKPVPSDHQQTEYGDLGEYDDYRVDCETA